MESDPDGRSEREREFFGSESEDDMKISHAGSDEEMIQTSDMRAGADDPGSEETKISQDEEDTQTAVTTRTRGTRTDTLTFPRLVHALHQGQIQKRPTQKRD